MIIRRYLNREILKSATLITSLFSIILLAHLLVRFINQVAGGKLALTDLGLVLMIEAPRLISVLLPFALYFAILLVYRRLHVDHEITALTACGFSTIALVRMMFPMIGLVIVITILLMNWINPQVLSSGRTKLARTGAMMVLKNLQAGHFYPLPNDRGILYAERISPNHQTLSRLFLATELDKLPLLKLLKKSSVKPVEIDEKAVILTAAAGYQWQDPETQKLFLIMHNGQLISGTPGKNDYDLLRFQRLQLPLITYQNTADAAVDTYPFYTLWRYRHDLLHAIELQWRLAIPLSTLLLALVAMMLSRTQPRQGHHRSILYGLLFYIVYLNGLLMGRHWMKVGQISVTWGLWWVHGLCLIAAFVASLANKRTS